MTIYCVHELKRKKEFELLILVHKYVDYEVKEECMEMHLRLDIEAVADVIKKIEKARVSKEAEGGENLNFEGLQDDMDDSMSISHAPKKRPTTSNSSSRKRRRTEDLEENGESFKELTTLFVTEMKETSSHLS
ncbi:hypothetical protein WN943_010293 [Citrus x changshan-huyou]